MYHKNKPCKLKVFLPDNERSGATLNSCTKTNYPTLRDLAMTNHVERTCNCLSTVEAADWRLTVLSRLLPLACTPHASGMYFLMPHATERFNSYCLYSHIVMTHNHVPKWGDSGKHSQTCYTQQRLQFHVSENFGTVLKIFTDSKIPEHKRNVVKTHDTTFQP